MKKAPLVAVANDLSGYGRCSLCVALPILAAMGLQGCPVPTAILSNHTGFPSCTFEDTTDRMEAYLAEWRKLDLCFDGVCTGFLGGEGQAAILGRLLDEDCRADAVKLVDPAMADGGALYSTCSPALVEAMKTLVAKSTVTTPNLTEACLLTGTPYAAVASLAGAALEEAVFNMAERIAATGPAQVVVTGIVQGDEIANLVVDHGARYVLRAPHATRSFAGTGDVFAAALCGFLMRGTPLREAVERVARFVAEATAHTLALDLPATDGIEFEAYLGQLREE